MRNTCVFICMMSFVSAAAAVGAQEASGQAYNAAKEAGVKAYEAAKEKLGAVAGAAAGAAKGPKPGKALLCRRL